VRFVLEVNLDNAAFVDDPTELARILREVADSPDIASPGCRTEGVKVRDINGNTVGVWEIQ
jgi:hypothetical protein